MTHSVSVAALAKVNLRLRVLGREQSGFHSLESIFCAVTLCDEIVVAAAAGGIELAVAGGIDTGPAGSNLVVRAAEAFYRALGRQAAVRIELRKRIPAAAGLGGGSSDAAATLRALNLLHDEPLDRTALLPIGAALGSDVPFFLCGSPLALGWGRGERLLALPPLEQRHVLIAHPRAAIATAEAFRWLRETRADSYAADPEVLELAALRSWEGLAPLADNDFEPVVVPRVDGLAGALATLRAAGPTVAMLSGSGAAFFGVFAEAVTRDAAAAALEARSLAVWRVRTVTEMPVPQVDRAAEIG